MKLSTVALALFAAACRIPPVSLNADSASGQHLTNRTEFGEKTVRQKKPPLTFIASDGSRCTVDELTYRDIRVGEKATCMWEYTGTR